MTQKNIDVMDIIVSKMKTGTKFSKALGLVYNKRNVCIPYDEKLFNEPLMSFNMSYRVTNALLKMKFKTVGDIVNFCEDYKITDIPNLGKGSGVEIFEMILDYCWDHMSMIEKESFLIDTVERNSEHIRPEIV